MTGRRAQAVIAICWVLSIVIGLTPMMGWTEGPQPSKVCPPGLINCMFEDVVSMAYMVYFNFFGCVLLPLLLMLAIYICIFMAARRQLQLMELKAGGVHGERSGSTLQKEVQAAKSLAIIVGLFAVCWLPLHIINCFTYFCPPCPRPPELIMYTAIILSHGNSVINPLIYAYRIREFRQTFRRIIHRHILGRSILGRPPQLESSSAHTSIYNSVSDTLRPGTDSLRGQRPSQQEAGCSGGGGPADSASLRGGLIAVSHAPLSIIISHRPHLLSCPHRPPRQTGISVHPPLQQVEAAQGSGAPDWAEEEQQGGAGPARVTVLLNEGKSNSCFAELVS